MTQGFTDADVPDQSGRCFVVTGANTGIGFEVARVLATRGARVLLACRDEAKAVDAIDRIGASASEADLAVVPLDLADLASVRAAVDRIGTEPRLDGVVNNAGMMSPSARSTAAGIETHIAVNHLGPFALTVPLVSKLAATPGARVVITSSLGHKSGRIDKDHLTEANDRSGGDLYCQSKLANLLFLLELDRRLRADSIPVTAVGCHPGVASTELTRDFTGWMRAFAPVMRLLANSALQGAWPTLQATTDPAIEPGGYYGPQRLGGARGTSGPAPRSERAQTAELAEWLWERSAALTGIDPELR